MKSCNENGVTNKIMYVEATIKFRINYHNKENAEPLVQTIIDDIKEYEKSPIVFIEKPEVVNITEVGVDCYSCDHYHAEEQILGDDGLGLRKRIHHFCGGSVLPNPITIHCCDDYKNKREEE